jgi:hypothetical protein
MKSLIFALFVCLQAMAQDHNNMYPSLQDSEAIAIFKDFLVSRGISGKCHQTSQADEAVNWKFREVNGQFMAEAVGDNFVTRTSTIRSFKADVGNRGNIRIWDPVSRDAKKDSARRAKFQLYYWMNLRQQHDEYKIDMNSGGGLSFYTETDRGYDVAGSCDGKPGEYTGPNPEKIYKAKPAAEEPPPPKPSKKTARLKPAFFGAPKLCPFEKEIAKEYLLKNNIRFTLPHSYRERDVPMILNLSFRERGGQLFAVNSRRLLITEFKFILEGADNETLFPVEVGTCEDFSMDEGKACGVQIRFPKYSVSYYVNVPSRQLDPPPHLAWDCSSESYDRDLFGYGQPVFKQSCQVEATNFLQYEIEDPRLTKVVIDIPKCKLESAPGD